MLDNAFDLIEGHPPILPVHRKAIAILWAKARLLGQGADLAGKMRFFAIFLARPTLQVKQAMEKGCTPQRMPEHAPSGLKRLRRKAGFWDGTAKNIPQGLKPPLISLALCRG